MYSAWDKQNCQYFATGASSKTIRECAETILTEFLWAEDDIVPNVSEMTPEQILNELAVYEVEIHRLPEEVPVELEDFEKEPKSNEN